MIKTIKQSLDATANNKLNRMGYTVDYSEVLAYLYNPVPKTTKVYTNESDALLSSSTYSEYYATILGDGSDGLKGSYVNGFVDEVSLQQGVCIVKPWLSFPITAKSTSGEQLNYNVSVETPNDEGILNGNTLCGASTTIKSKMDKEYVNSFKGEGGNFLIGVGVDLDNFGPKYFQHFYDDESKWAETYCTGENLRKLAERMLLFAEITLDIDGGKIMNSPVIISAADPVINGVPQFALWMPCPLLCTSRYSSLGEVVFKTPNKKDTTLDKNDTSYPFKNSGFEHKKGTLRGLNTSFYDTITQRTDGEKNLDSVRVNWKLRGDAPDKLARVRLYFDETKKAEVNEILGTEIPESGQRVFGPLKEVATEKLSDTTSYHYDSLEEIYWKDGMCPPGITREQYEKCLRIIWTFELGTKTFKIPKGFHAADVNYNPNGKNKLTEDFISYGVMQYIEDTENWRITPLIWTYEEVCKESGKPYDMKLINDAKTIASNRSGLRGRSTIPKNLLHALEELWNDPRMWYALTKRYATSSPSHEYNVQSKYYNDASASLWGAKFQFNRLKLSSAFGLLIMMDLHNQGLQGFKLGFKEKYAADVPTILALPSEYEKLLFICNRRISQGSHFADRYAIYKRNLEASKNDLSLKTPMPWHNKISV